MNTRGRNILLLVIAWSSVLPAAAQTLQSSCLLRLEMSENFLPLKNPAVLTAFLRPQVNEILYPQSDSPPAEPNLPVRGNGNGNRRTGRADSVIRLTPVTEESGADEPDPSLLLNLEIDLTGIDNPPLTARQLRDRIIDLLNQVLTGYYNEHLGYLQQRQQILANEIARAEQQLQDLWQQTSVQEAADAPNDIAALQQELAEVIAAEETAARQITFLQEQVEALLGQLQLQFDVDPLISYLREMIEFYTVVLDDLEDKANISPYERDQIAFLHQKILDARLEITRREDYLTNDYEGPQVRQYYNQIVQLTMELAGLQNRRELLARQIEQTPAPAPPAEPTTTLQIHIEARQRELQRLLDDYNRIQSRLILLSPPRVICIGS